jgi:hypothetical protein
MRHALLASDVLAAACGAPAPSSPSDDPADWPVDDSVTWRPVLGEPRFIVPARNLPPEAAPVLPSNDDADVILKDGRLFFAWRTSYLGNHYGFGQPSELKAFFTKSTDGVTWTPVKGDGVVYTGGVSEVGFEFDGNGDLWAVTRNEDGDATGFGSHVCTAPRDDLGTWTCSARSNPECYDSPRMFRHGKDLYLVARRDIGGPFDQGRTDLSFAEAQLQYAAAYSGRAKRTALYRIDRNARQVVWLFDFPSAGDTAFPGIVRLDAHRLLISNYTSPLDKDLDRSWWNAQNSEDGTRLYLVELEFKPAP